MRNASAAGLRLVAGHEQARGDERLGGVGHLATLVGLGVGVGVGEHRQLVGERGELDLGHARQLELGVQRRLGRVEHERVGTGLGIVRARVGPAVERAAERAAVGARHAPRHRDRHRASRRRSAGACRPPRPRRRGAATTRRPTGRRSAGKRRPACRAPRRRWRRDPPGLAPRPPIRPGSRCSRGGSPRAAPTLACRRREAPRISRTRAGSARRLLDRARAVRGHAPRTSDRGCRFCRVRPIKDLMSARTEALDRPMVDRGRRARSPRALRRRGRHWLPKGQMLPEHIWRRRHSTIVALVWLHAAGLFAFGLSQGRPVPHMLVDISPILVAAYIAGSETMQHEAARRRRVVRARDLLGGARAPLGRRHRGALPLLRGDRDPHALPGLDAVPGRDRLRRGPPRPDGRARAGERLQPPRRDQRTPGSGRSSTAASCSPRAPRTSSPGARTRRSCCATR